MNVIIRRKLKDMRVHLSDKLIRGSVAKVKQQSFGDDEVVGLRIFIFPGGQKTFYYCYSDNKTKKRHKEKLGNYPSINCVQARNRAKVIAVKVMEGVSASQIKREVKKEPTVNELFAEYEKQRLKGPQYKPSSIKKWKTIQRVWIEKKTKDPIIKTMFARSKVDAGSLKLSQVNMDNLKELHGLIGSKTTNNANAAIQMFSVVFGYAVEKKYISKNPVEFKKADFYEQKENNKYLTREQIEMVLSYALKYDERSESPKLNLDYYKSKGLKPVSCSIICNALLGGHRYRDEGAKVRWKQVSFHQSTLSLDDSKVGQRIYKIGPRNLKLLKAIKSEYLRGDSPFWYPHDIRREYIFPSYNFGKINNAGKVNELPYVNCIKGTWRTILKRLNIDYLPPYNMRHSFLTDALSKTKNLKMVKEIAGHRKISTTERYARVLGEDVTDALELIDKQEVAAPKVIKFSK